MLVNVHPVFQSHPLIQNKCYSFMSFLIGKNLLPGFLHFYYAWCENAQKSQSGKTKSFSKNFFAYMIMYTHYKKYRVVYNFTYLI